MKGGWGEGEGEEVKRERVRRVGEREKEGGEYERRGKVG